MFSDFHFLHPLWLLGLFALGLPIWLLRHPPAEQSAWRKVCDAALLPYLLLSRGKRTHGLSLTLLSVAWVIATLALSDPTWNRKPQAVFKTADAQVIVLDLSQSMNTPDLKPTRLSRARYKVADALKRNSTGQSALVVFAADAFTVSPLTHDAQTIDAMLGALDPSIMPEQGSHADLGLTKAGELLNQAGNQHGDILLLTDGLQGDATVAVAKKLRAQGYTVSVLGVGTEEGAPLPDANGGFVHDRAGNIVVPRLDAAQLREVALAGGGRYASITNDNSDLATLLKTGTPSLDTDRVQTDMQASAWRERGPWLVPLLLPFAALAFRRGWLLTLVLGVTLSGFGFPLPSFASGWDNLWARSDQQAAKALRQGDFAQAGKLATDPERKGSANYLGGDYQAALQEFSRVSGADADYNRGNTLAQLGQYSEAIAAYDAALQKQPGMQDAEFNKALLQKLLQQQKQQAQQQQQNQPQQPSSSSGDAKSSSDDAKENAGSQQQNKAATPGEAAQNQQDQNQASGDSAKQDGRQGQNQDEAQAAKENQAQSPGGESSNDAQAKTDSATNDAQNTGQEQDSQHTAQAASDKPDDTKAQAERQNPSKDSGSSPDSLNARDENQSAPQDTPAGASRAASDSLNREEKQAAEQWLRRIPDDPGGLLRRKFLYQYQQRASGETRTNGQTW